MKRRNRIAFIFIAVMLTVLLVGCSTNSTNTVSNTQNETNEQSKTAEADKKKAVNIYSARHYEIDDVLYKEFTNKTGITINLVEGKAEELIERIKREGNNTPADLFITVDGGVLNNAKLAGILQPIMSTIVDNQVPAKLRDKDNQWVGLSTRARVIVYAKDRVRPEQLSTYEDLVSDKWKGKVLVRSSTNMYNQSMLASFIAINGELKAKEWAQGIVANLARTPEGADRDQAKAIVAGIGDVAIMNTYYVGQLSVSEDPEEVKVAEKVGVFFPNQDGTGTHQNISGVGLIKSSKNKDSAVKLIEFLTGEEAQSRVSAENFEYPVNTKAKLPELLKSWGTFKTQDVDFGKLGEFNKNAVEIMNKVGWK